MQQQLSFGGETVMGASDGGNGSGMEALSAPGSAAQSMLASTSGQSFVLPDGREVLVSYDDEGECQMEVRSANPNEDVWTPRRRVGNGAVGKVLREGGGGRVVRLGQSEDDKLCAKSLMYFRQSHWLRRWCIAIWRNPNFEVFIILLIFANCATLALYDPTMPEGEGKYNKVGEDSEPVFTTLFTLEMVIKVIAMGLAFAPNTYVRDGWNCMDGSIVILSLIGLVVPAANITAIRTVRVLRPLRSISVLPGMRILVSTILKSMGPIGNVLLLCLFLFFVFGILGVQLFAGALRNRCVQLDATSGQPLFVVDEEAICTNATYPAHGPHCDAEANQVCMDWSEFTPPDFFGPNPNYGITHFDDFLYATLAMFQSITLEGWTPIMYNCMDGTSSWAFVYFALLVFFGSFFVLNLALAVVTEMLDATAKEISTEMEGERIIEEANEEAERELAAREGDDLEAGEEGAEHAATPPIKRQKQENVLQQAAGVARDAAGRATDAASQAADAIGLGDPEDDAEATLSIRGICKAIISHPFFSPFVTGVILLNTLALAVEYDSMPEGVSNALEEINFAFSIFFIIEMALKVLGLGFKKYTEDRFNQFDALVVGMSIIEMASAGGGSLSALRAFRILRVLKLVRSWVSLQKFLMTVYHTVMELGNLCFVVVLVIFIFALLGMRLFGNSMNDLPDGRPRHHFDSLLWAMVTVFQVLTGEDWNAIMYDCMLATSGAAALYFVALLVFGNFLIVNLFIGILLSNFGEGPEGDDDDEKDAEQIEYEKKLKVDAKQRADEEEKLQEMRVACIKADPSPWAGNATARLHEFERKSMFLFAPDHPLRTLCFRVVDDKRFEYVIMCLIAISSGVMAYEAPSVTADAGTRAILEAVDYAFTAIFCLEMVLKLVAFGVWAGPYAYVRDGWNVLDGTIVVLAVVGAALKDLNLGWVRALRTLRALRPLRAISRIPELKVVVNALIASFPGMGNVLIICLVFWLIFGILGMNLFMGKFHYCTDGVEDVLYGVDRANCTGLVCAEDCEVPRLAQCSGLSLDYEGVRALAAAEPAALDAGLALPDTAALVWAMVDVDADLNPYEWAPAGGYGGIIDFPDEGLRRSLLQGGRFAPEPAPPPSPPPAPPMPPPVPGDDQLALAEVYLNCSRDFVECEAEHCTEMSWENYPMNFDNIGKAMQTLFEMSTTEGWTAVMYQGVDAVDVDKGPIEYYNEGVTGFFLAFMVVGSFFILNLFVGIVLDNFAKLREESASGSVFLTVNQKAWVDATRMAIDKRAEAVIEPPDHPTRQIFFRTVQDVRFEYTVMAVIMLNTITMAMNHYDMSDEWQQLLDAFNYAFTIFFTGEAGAKLVGLGLGNYFEQAWNKFDFVVVIASWLGIILGTGGPISAIRIFRIARAFRLVKRMKSLRTMFITLIVALPTLINVFMLVLLVFFVFAVLGINLFGTVNPDNGPCGELSEHANFSTFGKAMLLLFRASTGEAWNCVMVDVMVQPPNCDPTEIEDEDGNILKYNDCGSLIAPLYFIAFVVIGSFLMLNLLIAVVLENFSANSKVRFKRQRADQERGGGGGGHRGACLAALAPNRDTR